MESLHEQPFESGFFQLAEGSMGGSLAARCRCLLLSVAEWYSLYGCTVFIIHLMKNWTIFSLWLLHMKPL